MPTRGAGERLAPSAPAPTALEAAVAPAPAAKATAEVAATTGMVDASPRVGGVPGGELVALAVPGHEDALVAVPAGAPAPRPLVVATHGAGGTPEAHCRYWRGVVGDRAFVLCPRGRPIAGPSSGVPNTGFYYPDHLALGREVGACVRAAAARFAGDLDASAAVYVGFSQGATMGALMLGHEPGAFARAVLVEGGFDAWSPASAAAFRAGGGERVALACGRPLCTEGALATTRRLARAGLATRAVHDERSGHALAGPLADEVARVFDWVVEGDARFAR